jgi:hypothetical protein
MDNLQLSADFAPVIDLSDATKYRWNVCAPAEK